jgi:hypothetical protein
MIRVRQWDMSLVKAHIGKMPSPVLRKDGEDTGSIVVAEFGFTAK